MNYKILGSMLLIGMASASIGYGTYAAFSDTEVSTGNLFTAGNLFLELDGIGTTTAFITSGEFAPGDSETGTLIIKNVGSIRDGDRLNTGVRLYMKPSVTNAAFAQWVQINSVTYGGTAIAVSDSPSDANSFVDLGDLVAAYGTTPVELPDPGNAKNLMLEVTFHWDAPNSLNTEPPQTLELNLDFELKQVLTPAP